MAAAIACTREGVLKVASAACRSSGCRGRREALRARACDAASSCVAPRRRSRVVPEIHAGWTCTFPLSIAAAMLSWRNSGSETAVAHLGNGRGRVSRVGVGGAGQTKALETVGGRSKRSVAGNGRLETVSEPGSKRWVAGREASAWRSNRMGEVRASGRRFEKQVAPHFAAAAESDCKPSQHPNGPRELRSFARATASRFASCRALASAAACADGVGPACAETTKLLAGGDPISAEGGTTAAAVACGVPPL